MTSWRPLLAALATLGGEPEALEWHNARSWGSITFAGERHRLCYLFTGTAVARGEQLVADLPTHEFDLPGVLVADAAIVEVYHNANPAWLRVVVELLVLEEG